MIERSEKLANIWANRRAEDEKLGITYTFSETALEQFTKMIVKECADYLNVAMEVYTQSEQDLYDRGATKIKQHFGVEE